MAYQWNYINKFIQLGIVNYTLRLVDDQEIFQELFIPIILTENENTEENLNNIALDMINKITSEIIPPEVENVVLEETPVEETPVEETPVETEI